MAMRICASSANLYNGRCYPSALLTSFFIFCPGGSLWTLIDLQPRIGWQIFFSRPFEVSIEDVGKLLRTNLWFARVYMEQTYVIACFARQYRLTYQESCQRSRLKGFHSCFHMIDDGALFGLMTEQLQFAIKMSSIEIFCSFEMRWPFPCSFFAWQITSAFV